MAAKLTTQRLSTQMALETSDPGHWLLRRAEGTISRRTSRARKSSDSGNFVAIHGDMAT
jgi:hypothetical protein